MIWNERCHLDAGQVSSRHTTIITKKILLSLMENQRTGELEVSPSLNVMEVASGARP